MENNFLINEWIQNLEFNGKKLRVLNTPDDPFFYAIEVASILGAKNVRQLLPKYNIDTEIVSAKTRKDLSIQTYKLRNNGKYMLDNNMALLTIYGVYKLVSESRSIHSDSFMALILRHFYFPLLKYLENILSPIQFKNDSSYVYFITSDPYSSKWKIGYSSNPARRLTELQIANPDKLYIYKLISTSYPHDLEQKIHKAIGSAKITGEWFSLEFDEVDAIYNTYL